LILAAIRVEALLYNVQSLKEKRSIIKSVSTRVKQRLNVSFAEIDHQDLWQRTEWAIVSVGSEKKQVERELQRAISIIESYHDLELTKISWEWL